MLNRIGKIFKKQKQQPKTQAQSQAGYDYRYFDGDKFIGGFGDTRIYSLDYDTLILRSSQLFRDNLYARGLLRRLVTNEINQGLNPSVQPIEDLLDKPRDSLAEWSENVENRFGIWAGNKELCDTARLDDFYEIQRKVRMESLICGDVLVILRIDNRTNLPRVQIIPGDRIRSPLTSVAQTTNYIYRGVELNKYNQHVAFYILDRNNEYIRIPARGTKSNRQIAWMVYGCDRRASDVRGEPLLSIILQSIKELDRYRDAMQRKAAINAILAMFVKKGQQLIGSAPLSSGAARKLKVTEDAPNNTKRQFKIQEQMPGMVVEELQAGEEIVGFGNQAVDFQFAEFESSVISAIAWANEIPPEILQLAFSSNYSASQAANNEYRNYLNKFRAKFGSEFCTPIYRDWLLAEILTGRIKADGFLESWADKAKFSEYGAWVEVNWGGAIKPALNLLDLARYYEIAVKYGWCDNARVARELTGTKFSRNIRNIRLENIAIQEANSVKFEENINSTN